MRDNAMEMVIALLGDDLSRMNSDRILWLEFNFSREN
jgi:hypothetical protein